MDADVVWENESVGNGVPVAVSLLTEDDSEAENRERDNEALDSGDTEADEENVISSMKLEEKDALMESLWDPTPSRHAAINAENAAVV